MENQIGVGGEKSAKMPFVSYESSALPLSYSGIYLNSNNLYE